MSLKGKTLVITRPEGQAGELASLISALGGVPRIVPTVEIRPLKNLLFRNGHSLRIPLSLLILVVSVCFLMD